MRAQTSNSSTPPLANFASCTCVWLPTRIPQGRVLHNGTESQRPKMGQDKPLLLSLRCISYTGAPSCRLPFSSLPSQVGCSACVSAQQARKAEGNTSLDGLQAAIHRAQSVAVYRDVAASVPAGMQVWQIGRTITLVLLTTV